MTKEADFNPINWDGVLRDVSKCRRANPHLTHDQAVAVVRIAYEQRLLRETAQLIEETRRWRYNLVESGILDIEGKPLVF